MFPFWEKLSSKKNNVLHLYSKKKGENNTPLNKGDFAIGWPSAVVLEKKIHTSYI